MSCIILGETERNKQRRNKLIKGSRQVDTNVDNTIDVVGLVLVLFGGVWVGVELEEMN